MIAIDQLARIRALATRLVEGLDDDARRVIPSGFKNNVLWNAGHLVVTQQLLHYRLSGLPMLVPDDMVDAFKKGSSPDDATAFDWELIRELLTTLPQRLRDDHDAGVFEEYQPYETSAGVTLSSIEDAIAFNNFHEGLHIGTIMALRKFA